MDSKSEKDLDFNQDENSVPYLSKLGHELKTPIHGIQGLAEYLMNNWDATNAETQKKCIESIHEASVRLMELVNTISSDNYNQESIGFNFAKTNLVDVIKTTVDNFRNVHLLNKSIELELNIHIDDFISDIDEFWCQQLLTNLLVNSLNYSSKGTISVDVRPKVLEDIEYLVISVADEGVGIPESELASIFAPFNRGSRTNVITKGSGLGLSICREIVQAHGGAIAATNNEKIGSTVEFSIPKTR